MLGLDPSFNKEEIISRLDSSVFTKTIGYTVLTLLKLCMYLLIFKISPILDLIKQVIKKNSLKFHSYFRFFRFAE